VSRVSDVGENFSAINTTIIVGRQASLEEQQVYEPGNRGFTQALRLDPNNSYIYLERGVAVLLQRSERLGNSGLGKGFEFESESCRCKK
jgi:hypothetical protein